MKHVELHNHTHYSILDGASTPAEYLARAKELGMSHLAITDHGTTAGHREFQREAEKVGIKPILGVEAYITTDRFDRRTVANRQDGTSIYNHITLLAENAEGLKNIEHINKIAWAEGYYHKPRIDIELLENHSGGIIALSGCMSGMVAKSILNGDDELAVKYAKRFKDILGDRYFIEVMESNSPELNGRLVEIGKELGIKPVVTSDCHMANERDLPLAEAMLILNTNPGVFSQRDMTKVAKMKALEAMNYLYPKRKMSFAEFELWIHTYEEHRLNLEKHGIGPEAIDNTMLIADRIGDYPYYKALDTLPEPQGIDDAADELRKRTYQGLKDRNIDTPENRERIEEELGVIIEKGLASYFIIETEFIDFAKANDILTGYGRGSAVSYLTNYALGITKINPMPYNLLPERFLSLDREDPADIDTDFAIDGRYRVKENVQRTYPNVSNIATIGYYKDKSALKAAAKIFKAPFTETTRLANMTSTIGEFAKSKETLEYRQRFPHVVPLAMRLNDRIQNFGMHAGGIVLSKEPIENYAPLQTANDPQDEAKDRVSVAALDMSELAEMGFVKYDLLGLRTLSIVDDTIRLIEKRHGIKIDIEEIPLDDQNIYNMISRGETAGLFQAEASASTKTILDMGGVTNFAELVASNALVRPGAANSTVGETYITGKKTGRIKKMHASIDGILEETYGAVLYQEQQLLLCEYIAGMSKADSNKVRKAISKKIPEDLAKWKDEFIAGATKNLGAAKAAAVWKDLEASADYAFAKAHAVGYSMLTLLTAYLKYYYPIEFLVCSLNRMNSSNKSDRMKVIKYMIEARRLGIRVVLPHINSSGVDIEIQKAEDGSDMIRLGLSQIKGIGGKTAEPILRHAPFNSYKELKEVPGIRANTLGSLNAIGAAEFPDNPARGDERDNLFKYLSIPALGTKDIPAQVLVQFKPLIDYDEKETFICMAIVGGDKKKPGWRLIDIVDESATASAFVPENSPIEVGEAYIFLISNNSVVKYMSVADFTNDLGAEFQEFLEAESLPDVTEGLFKVVHFNARTTKAGKHMADVVLADEDKNMFTALVWPNTFAEAHTKCKEGNVIDARFSELDDGGYAISYFL